ncbi:hypothetical protein GN958_ATG19836 [Phytophthora infestans]|uniref:Transposase Tc1-like domain-containing protein n=1 Tax=Phytophthora infestans TaxID=4787 RepID=A0A8S9TQ19_PHYIN|nr:hypothetical protein GN958_ATG19836 [Phytophthora infestans]
MRSPASDESVDVAGATTSPSPSWHSSVHGEPPSAPQAEIEAPTETRTSFDNRQLRDDILLQFMETHETRDGKVLQEMLSTTPYNVNMSYEVVQRRVTKLLDEERPSATTHTIPDNDASTSEETTEHNEKEKPRQNNTDEDADQTDNQVDEKTQATEKQTHEKVAHHLDMLADTVRSIATDVVEAEATLLTAEKDTVNTQHNTDGNVDDETETHCANGASPADKPSVDGGNSTQTADIASVPASDTIISVDISSTDTANICNDALATKEKSSKRPATHEGKAKPTPKRQKRAEYSVETRALCVRRHQADGASYATISKELGIPHDTVRAIVRKAKRTGSVVSAPRSGRPRKTSGLVDNVILEAVRSNKQCSAKSIQEELLRVYGVKLSPETVRRRVLEHTKLRIQSMSNGATIDTSTVAPETATPSSQSRLAALDTSLSDTVSFQHLLNGERQSRAGSKQEASAPDRTLDAEEVPDISTQSSEKRSTNKRKKRAEYSVEKREQCVALHAHGQGYRSIGKTLNMPHTTVRAIVEKAQRTGSVLPAKRSGRPRKTDAIVDKVILQAVKNNERSSARIIKEQLQAAYGVRISCETIRRRVKDHSRQCMTSTSVASTNMAPVSVAVASLTGEAMANSPAATLLTFGVQI